MSGVAGPSSTPPRSTMSSSLITDLPKGIVPVGAPQRRLAAHRRDRRRPRPRHARGRRGWPSQQARTEGRSTGDMLVARGTLTSDELARVLAERFSVDYVDLGVFSVDMNAAHLIASDAARRYEAVPIGYLDERTLLLATADPGNIVAFDDITMKTGLDVRPVVASREDLAVLDREARAPGRRRRGRGRGRGGGHRRRPARRSTTRRRSSSSSTRSSPRRSTWAAATSTSPPRATGCRSTTASTACSRARAPCPRPMVRGVVSRVKIMANLDISEKRIPQDGRLSLTVTRPARRRARRDAAAGHRRVGRHAHPRPRRRRDRARRARHARRRDREAAPRDRPAVRRDPRDRARPAPARRRRSTARSPSSTRATARSSRSRTRSSTASRASSSCRSTRRPACTSRAACAR